MKKFILKNSLYIIGGIIGAIGGYLYYIFIGCTTGSCPITSSPTLSVVWGALMGGLIFSMFDKRKNNGKTM